MKLSSIGKLTAVSLAAGTALAFAGTPADAQTIPSRTAVIDGQNVVNVVHQQNRAPRASHTFRRQRFSDFHGPSFGFGIGLGLAAPLLASPFTSPYGYGYGPSYGYGTSYGLAAPTTRYATGAMTPGSPQWIEYCSQKYRSFDPASGTYLAYSGVRRPCQVP